MKKTAKELHAEADALKAQARRAENEEQCAGLSARFASLGEGLNKLGSAELNTVSRKLADIEDFVLKMTAGVSDHKSSVGAGEGNCKYSGQYNG